MMLCRKVFTSSIFVAALALTTPGSAQDAPILPSPAVEGTATCELHIWPGGDLHSTYYGWFHGGIVDGAVAGREGYRQLPAKPLPTSEQLAVFKDQNLPALLQLPGYTVIAHETALDSRTLRTTAGRLLTGAAPCYAELAVDDVFFQEDLFSGKFLKVILRFRRFDGGAMPVRTFGAVLSHKLVLFPPLKAEDDPAAGLAELRSGFAAILKNFASQLNAAPRKKH